MTKHDTGLFSAVDAEGVRTCAVHRETCNDIYAAIKEVGTGRVVYRDKGFTYTTFVMDISPEDKYHLTSNLRLNWENDEAAWFTVPEALALPNLHFGAKYVLERL